MEHNYLALKYFLEVAKHENFSQAAKILHISQPALSKQISSLEKELKVKLFERTTRKVQLTQEGEFLYNNLLHSFENINNTVLRIRDYDISSHQKIRISTVPSAASSVVPILIKRLKKQFENIEFYLTETTTDNSIELVRRNEADIALIRTPIDIKQKVSNPMVWKELKRYPLVLAVSSDHKLSHKKSVQLEEISNESFLHYDPKNSPSLYYLLEYACLSAGFIPKVIGVGPEFLTRANLIANGIGVTLLPKDMFNTISNMKIASLSIENENLYSSISVVWNKLSKKEIIKYSIQSLR